MHNKKKCSFESSYVHKLPEELFHNNIFLVRVQKSLLWNQQKGIHDKNNLQNQKKACITDELILNSNVEKHSDILYTYYLSNWKYSKYTEANATIFITTAQNIKTLTGST